MEPGKSPAARNLRTFLLIVAAALVCACASIRGSDAPGCSGKQRPANPNGSVLAPQAEAPAAGTGHCGGRRP